MVPWNIAYGCDDAERKEKFAGRLVLRLVVIGHAGPSLALTTIEWTELFGCWAHTPSVRTRQRTGRETFAIMGEPRQSFRCSSRGTSAYAKYRHLPYRSHCILRPFGRFLTRSPGIPPR